MAESLDPSIEEILVVGPGVARTHFKTHLETHHHEGLLKKVVGFETLDSITENQILAYSREFFQKAHLFVKS